MSAMFRSFANINYRIWFAGALISNVGGWMQATAQDWVVLTELTDNDATAMGVTMALQFGPPLVLVSLTGWVADRFDRRHILFATQSALLALAIAVGVLLLNDLMTLPMMFGFALGFGIVNAFDAPARQAFVSDMVSAGDTSNAVALNSASFNLARMVGPAVGGLLIVAIGSGWVFIVNAATFLAMLLALMLMRRSLLAPRLKSRNRGGLAAGFRYVWGRSDLKVVFVTVFLIGASTMALEFGAGADGYGVLSSVLAIGSLIGALLAARRDRARVRVVILAAGGFGIAAFVSSAMPSYASYAVTLTFTGFMIVTLLTTANGYVQITTDPALRGRVLALYMAVIMGSTPVGAPIAGWVADTFGPRAAIMLGGTAGFIACAIGVIWVATSGRLRRDENRRFLLTLDETRPLSVIDRPDPIEFSDEAAVTTPIRTPRRPDLEA